VAEKVEGPHKRIESRQFAKDAEFSPRPSELVLVAGLEIVVSDDYGDYLLIRNPHYEEIELQGKSRPAKPEDGFWSVPYITKTVNAHSGGFKHVAPAIELVDQEVNAWKPQKLLEDYVRTFSFGVPKIAPVGAFCELKHSWSQAHITKLYHIIRFSVSLDSCSHRNLADAASRGGFAFIPIDGRFKTVTRRRTCSTHQLKETLYLEQPLATNLSAVLEDEDGRRGLRSRAIKIDRGHFVRDQTGLLFCGDIAGYGAASAYAEDHMGGLTDADQGAILRDSATVAFTDLFLDAGISEIHIAGDGFICAMPVEKPSEASAALKRFSVAYATYLARLEDLNARITAYFVKNPSATTDAPQLGSRLAIHYGKYRYGKMSQAASLVTSFDGSDIVRVSRLEQGLRSVTKAPELAIANKIDGVLHTAAASRAVGKLLHPEKTVLHRLFKIGSQFEAASKEFQEPAWLLQRIDESSKPPRRRTAAGNLAKTTANKARR
jgi:hypothetical protein